MSLRRSKNTCTLESRGDCTIDLDDFDLSIVVSGDDLSGCSFGVVLGFSGVGGRLVHVGIDTGLIRVVRHLLADVVGLGRNVEVDRNELGDVRKQS